MGVLLFSLVRSFFSIYSMLLVIYALLSWLPGGYDSQLGKIVLKLTRPYLDFFDRYIPSIGGISISVIAALFVLQLIRDGLLGLLIRIF